MADGRALAIVPGAIRLGLRCTCPYWLAFGAAVVTVGGLLAAGPAAKYSSAGRQPLRLLRLRHGLLLLLE